MNDEGSVKLMMIIKVFSWMNERSGRASCGFNTAY